MTLLINLKLFIGLIVCPSRELAKQILENVEHYAECLVRTGMPRIKSCLIIGGTPVNQSLEIINRLFYFLISCSYKFLNFQILILGEFTSWWQHLAGSWTC